MRALNPVTVLIVLGLAASFIIAMRILLRTRTEGNGSSPVCETCGNHNRGVAKFCAQCGKSLSRPVSSPTTSTEIVKKDERSS